MAMFFNKTGVRALLEGTTKQGATRPLSPSAGRFALHPSCD